LAYISNDLLKEFFPTLNLRVRFNALKERLKKKFSFNNLDLGANSFSLNASPSHNTRLSNANTHQTIQLLFSPNQNDINNLNPSESLDLDMGASFSNNINSSNNQTKSSNKCPQMIEFPVVKLRDNLRKILSDPNSVLGKAEHNEIIEIVFNELVQYT
jgi:hypothetical protein